PVEPAARTLMVVEARRRRSSRGSKRRGRVRGLICCEVASVCREASSAELGLLIVRRRGEGKLLGSWGRAPVLTSHCWASQQWRPFTSRTAWIPLIAQSLGSLIVWLSRKGHYVTSGVPRCAPFLFTPRFRMGQIPL